MLRNRLPARLMAAFCMAAGLAFITVLSPMTAMAHVQPNHQTLYQDVQHVQNLENNAYFLELASEACIARATDANLLTLCTNIHIDQVWQVRNARLTIKIITNIWPSSPVLSPPDQPRFQTWCSAISPSCQPSFIRVITR